MSPIDDLFRNKLSDHGIPYNDSYWEGMEAMIDDKKKKKPFFLLPRTVLLVAGLFGLGIAITAIYFYRGNSSAIVMPAQPAVTENSTSLNESKDLTPNKSETITSTQNNLNNTSTPITPKAEETQQEHSNHNAITRNQLPEVSKPSYLIIPPAPAPGFIVPEQVVVVEDKPQIKNELNIIAANWSPRKLESSAIILPLPYPEVLKPFESKFCKDLSKPWIYEITAGYSFNNYSRKVLNANIKQQETTRDQSGAFVNFGIHNNHWGLITGIGYLTLAEQTNYFTENIQYEFKTYYRMINPVYKQTPAGTKIAIIRKEIDTTITRTYSINNPNSVVRFNYLNIPLHATYQMMFQNWILMAEAGINNNILANEKGKYAIMENGKMNIIHPAKQQLAPVLFQTYTSLGIGYQFMQRYSIQGSYGYAYSLNSMVKSYEQKPTIQSFNIGLGIQLN